VRLSHHGQSGLLLILALGCAPVGATAPIAMPASPAAVAPKPDVRTSPTMLGSRSGTLDALRAEQGRRPVMVTLPGLARRAAIEPHTTDPVSHGFDLPKNAATVAWWSSGTAPGETTGTVVLAAHVVYNGRTGPFTRLERLSRGALVVLTAADGRTYRYAVTGSRYAPKAALDRSALFTTAGPPALALITCGGQYDPNTRSFADNLVVTAVPT